MNSPYLNQPQNKWLSITKTLIKEHPLSSEEIVEVVNMAWSDIFKSQIGTKPFHIGIDILPKPQIMGFLLHELIPLEFERRYPTKWRSEKSAMDKDLIYLPSDKFSIEIKTSSNKDKIFGNRSYAQEATADKKTKSGYYLTINFEKFGVETNKIPKVSFIRFGWIDHTDWLGQVAATGQQSRLGSDTYLYKLVTLYSSK